MADHRANTTLVKSMSRVEISRGFLQVLQAGSGRPLVFVHGFPLDHQMWKGQIQDLAEYFHVLAPDLRGFGASSDVANLVTMAEFADDLAEMLDALGIHEPIALCGLSMGGYIALEFWRRHRQRLTHLIFCDTRAAADSPEAAETRLQTAERVLREGSQVVADAMLPRLFAAHSLRQRANVVTATEQIMRAARPASVAAALRGMAQRADATAWLPDVDLPTLVVCGQEDVISSPPEMERMAAAMPQAEYVSIPACGHMAPLEDSVHVNKALRAFLGA